MQRLYDLKHMLCEELEKYGSQELTAGSLDVIDKLAHAAKNVSKVLEDYEEEEYSNARDGMSYTMGGNRGGNRGDTMGRRSYARGRGSNARRDARGRYSNEGYSYEEYSMAIAEDLRDLMKEAPDQQTKQDIQRIVTRLEQNM